MSKTWGLVAVGSIIALIAIVLMAQGNPSNMGVCVACFLRDTAGGLKLQTAAPVQYMRPEIFGFAIGALLIALVFKEFRPRAGSAPMTRFVLGFFMMLGCLVFLGCPLRLLLRLSAGDLNAAVGFVGLVAGITLGVLFLKKDFQLPANQEQSRKEGLVFPLIIIVLLLLLLFKSDLFAASTTGPGAAHAPILYALAAGVVIGALVQRTRFCTIGFISHIILFKRWNMFLGVFILVIVAFIGSVYLGRFKLGFEGQPIAHTHGLWNFLSMLLVGVCGVFLSGCPLRQIVKAGSGDGDGAMVVLGMLLGAAVAHNFALASSTTGATFGGKIIVIIGMIVVFTVGIIFCKKAPT